MPTRMSPLVSSMLSADRLASTVDTSALGEFDPSLVRKIGSSPSVASKRAWTCDGTIVQPSAGWWHDPHERPLVPRDWKNGLSKSMLPLTLDVRTMPVGSANPNMLGPLPSAGALGAIPSAATRPQTMTHARTNRGDFMANLLFIRFVRHQSSSGLRRRV